MRNFETLYRRHVAAVFRFAWGLCGDRSAAEDIVSETFLRLLTRSPKLEAHSVRAYLLTIARNCYLMGRRKRRREVPLPAELRAPAPDLDGGLDGRARIERVVGELAAMPEGERSALLLRIDHELSYEEVAAALGISVSAAKVRVHRARRRLMQKRSES